MTKQTAHLDAMAAMLLRCRDTFREYEQNHRAKSPPDHTKAIRNGNLADEIASLLRIVDGDDSGGQHYLIKITHEEAEAALATILHDSPSLEAYQHAIDAIRSYIAQNRLSQALKDAQ